MQSAHTLARSKARVNARYDDSKLVGTSWEAMIARSKELFRNSWLCNAILGCYTSYLTAPMPHSGTDAAQARFLQWWDHASMRGESLDAVYHQILSQWIINGDALIIFPSDGITSKLAVVDSARLRTPSDKLGQGIIHGAKFDKLGRVLGYYVCRVSPEGDYLLDSSADFDFYPTHDSQTGRPIAWLLRRPDSVSPSSARGLPIVSSILTEIEDLSDLSTASIQSAYTKALLSVILESSSPQAAADALGAQFDPATGALVPSADGVGLIGQLQPGAVLTVPAGTKATTVSNSGNTDLVALFQETLDHIGGAVSLPSEFLLSRFRGINFSSSKQSWDRMARNFGRYQDALTLFLSDVYKWVVLESMLADGLMPEAADLVCSWSPLREPNIDPTKSATAKKILLDAGLKSRSRILSEDGESYRDYLLAIKREQELELEILGAPLAPSAPSPIIIEADPADPPPSPTV